MEDRLGKPGNFQKENQKGEAFRKVHSEQDTVDPTVFLDINHGFHNFQLKIFQKTHQPL